MFTHLCLLKFALADLFCQVSHAGEMTLADRYGLLAAILENQLTEEEHRSIDRLLHSVKTGHIKVVNQLSMVTA